MATGFARLMRARPGGAGYGPIAGDPFPTNWWETPGVGFNAGYAYMPEPGLPIGVHTSAGTTRDVGAMELPGWASVMGISSPQTAYAVYQQAQRDPMVMATLEAAAETFRRRQGQVKEGIGTVSGIRGRYETELEGLRSDPELAAIEASLRGRTAPDYRMIGEAEEGAFQNELAQAVARATNARMTTAGATGQTFSGTTLQDVASVRAIGGAQGVRLRADIERANREARERATEQLASFEVGRRRLEAEILDEIAKADAAIAALQVGDVTQSPDFVPISELFFNREAFERAARLEEEELAAATTANEPNWMDTANLAASLGGTGIPEWIINLGSRFAGALF